MAEFKVFICENERVAGDRIGDLVDIQGFLRSNVTKKELTAGVTLESDGSYVVNENASDIGLSRLQSGSRVEVINSKTSPVWVVVAHR